MMISEIIRKNKDAISLIVDSLINMIKNPHVLIEKFSYCYHQAERTKFMISIILFKLMINDKEYIKSKYECYLKKYNSRDEFDLNKITNIASDTELDLILNVKNILNEQAYYYDSDKNIIVFNEYWIDAKWLTTFITLLLDNSKNNKFNKEINICYTIPNRDINKLTDVNDKEEFLSHFTYYSIKVKHTDSSKPVKENNILIVKNAAINYLKHLKQYKHGLENEESYLIFYNLLKNECTKEGFELEEKELPLSNIDNHFLDYIESNIDEAFCECQLSKQIHIIENIIWQLSNDITLLEHMNASLDTLIDLLSEIRVNTHLTYAELKEKNEIDDIKILLILIVNKFIISYLHESEELDYSLIDLSNIKPKYMSSICCKDEQEIKSRIRSLEIETNIAKKSIEKYKEERANLNKNILGEEKYQKELERCVGNINRTSIQIGTLNSKSAALSRTYDEIKKSQINKYKNVELFKHNLSIIKHICNSIIGCSFYLKTNNNSALLKNIIIFEDYERSDNSFYLEVSFKDLLKISNCYLLNGIDDQSDLPKLA